MLKEWIRNMGWLNLSTLSIGIYPKALAKFYSNLSPNFDGKALRFTFKNHFFTFTYEQLTDFLELNPSKDILNPSAYDINLLCEFFTNSSEPFSTSKYQASQKFFDPQHKVLHHFIATSINCCGTSHYIVTISDLILCRCDVQNEPINLSYFIFSKIYELVHSKPPRKLPFGMVITLILQTINGSLIGNPIPHSSSDTCNEGYFTRIRIRKINGKWIMSSQKEEPPSPQPLPSPPSSSSSSSSSQLSGSEPFAPKHSSLATLRQFNSFLDALIPSSVKNSRSS